LSPDSTRAGGDTLLALAGGLPTRLSGPVNATAGIVDDTVAVVIQAVAGFGGGSGEARAGSPDAAGAGAGPLAAGPGVRPAGLDASVQARAGFINSTVAIVVHSVAKLGRGQDCSGTSGRPGAVGLAGLTAVRALAFGRAAHAG